MMLGYMQKLSLKYLWPASVSCIALVLLFIATSCGGSAPGTPTPTPASKPVVTIAANPGTVAPGTPSTLTVTASNATQVVISNNLDSSTYTLAATGGTQLVTPTATTTYTATATGAGGTATAPAIVTVTAVVLPPKVTTGANPATIVQGSSSTLSVTASNATQVVVSNNLNSTRYTLAATGGTQSVTPTTTTTYTATATGPGGTATAQATVTVTAPPPPTVTIAASPATIVQGNSSILSVTASNATQVIISDTIDSTKYTLPAAGGTQSVSPSTTATYTAPATALGGRH